MPTLTIDGVPYGTEPFRVTYERIDNPEQRFSSKMSTCTQSESERTFVRRVPLRHPDLDEADAIDLAADLNAVGSVAIAGDALGATITVHPENVTAEPYGPDEILWAVAWEAIEV